ncbi:MAG: TolC family protein [Chitinophagaceae bacterium]
MLIDIYPIISRRYRSALFIFVLFISPLALLAQERDSVLVNPTLDKVLQYALDRQPVVQQSLIDVQITDQQIRSRLADWYPQISFNYVFQRNFQVPTNIIGGQPIQLGVANTSGLQFLGTQNIFNRDLLFASRTKGNVQLQAKQQVVNTKIDVVANVSKAFYDVLATQEQINVSIANITRLERSLKDATSQYNAGLVDKTDYKRAMILLNNARAALKANQQAVIAKTAFLKSIINYPVTQNLDISYDTASLEADIPVDTLQGIDVTRRIEFQILETQRKLQEANVRYNKWSYLPTLNANGGYFRNFLDDRFSKLYDRAFPQSFAGLTFAIPIFQGGKRKYDLNVAKLQLKRTDLDIINLKNEINSEYYNALAAYKSSLANYLAVKENVVLAQEVYDVITLQYRSGIRTYLDVVIAEAELRTSQITYYNALYDVLSSKIDVQRSLGNITPQ